MGDLGVPNQAPHSGHGRALSPTLLGESRSPDLQFLPVVLTPSYSLRRYIYLNIIVRSTSSIAMV